MPGDVPYKAARAALASERSHSDTTVQTCEVYWVGRHTSVPFLGRRRMVDYLYLTGRTNCWDLTGDLFIDLPCRCRELWHRKTEQLYS